MHRSDVFMHCGHLQFQKGSWHHRNYILLNGERKLLSVPTHCRFGDPIRDAWFDDPHWKNDHLETIALAYGDAPFFDDYFPTLKEIILGHPSLLERLNIELTTQIAEWLGVTTRTLEGTAWHFDGDAVDKIIQMCKHIGADTYLSNEGAKDYIDTNMLVRMFECGVHHLWLEWKDPDEEPLSAIHHLFTRGPEAARLLDNVAE